MDPVDAFWGNPQPRVPKGSPQSRLPNRHIPQAPMSARPPFPTGLDPQYQKSPASKLREEPISNPPAFASPASQSELAEPQIGIAPYTFSTIQQKPAPRQRPATACRYCRRHKIRCSGFEAAEDGRCTNCRRFEQEYIFSPVSAQTQAFVPAPAVWRDVGTPPPIYGADGQPLAPVTPAEAEGHFSLQQQYSPSPQFSRPAPQFSYPAPQSSQPAFGNSQSAPDFSLHTTSPNHQPPQKSPYGVDSQPLLSRLPMQTSVLALSISPESIPTTNFLKAYNRVSSSPPTSPSPISPKYPRNPSNSSFWPTLRGKLSAPKAYREGERKSIFGSKSRTSLGPPPSLNPNSHLSSGNDIGLCEDSTDLRSTSESTTIQCSDTPPSHVTTSAATKSRASNHEEEKSSEGPKYLSLAIREGSPDSSKRSCSPEENNIECIARRSPRNGDVINLAHQNRQGVSVESGPLEQESSKAVIYIPGCEESASSSSRTKEVEVKHAQVQPAFDDENSEGAREITEGLLVNGIAAMKEELLAELLDIALAEFEYPTELTDGHESATGTSSSGSTNAGPSGSSSGSSHTRVSSQKRPRIGNSGNDDGEASSGEGNDDENRRGRKELRLSVQGCRRLKCPFYQRLPNRYTRASCRGLGFVDLAKLKDHLKRVHSQPLQCTRCREEMPSEDGYAEHLQKDDICKKRPEVADDRISASIWQKLEFKKPLYSLHESADAKWRLMYKTLFPYDETTPSPYDEHGISSRMEQLLADELEKELAKELGPTLDPILSRIRDRIPSIIKRCKAQALDLPVDDSCEEVNTAPKQGRSTYYAVEAHETVAQTPLDFFRGTASTNSSNVPGRRLRVNDWLSQPSATSSSSIAAVSCPFDGTSTADFPSQLVGGSASDVLSAKSLGKQPQKLPDAETFLNPLDFPNVDLYSMQEFTDDSLDSLNQDSSPYIQVPYKTGLDDPPIPSTDGLCNVSEIAGDVSPDPDFTFTAPSDFLPDFNTFLDPILD